MPYKIQKTRSRTGLAAAALALGLLAGQAQAGDANGRFAPKGIGLMPCGQFIQAAEAGAPEAALAMSWVAGYISAANLILPETYDLISWQEGLLPSILASVCQQVPEEPIALAAAELISAFGPGRIQAAEQPEEIVVGERRRLLYPTTVRQMQQALRAAGQTVSVDGDFGPGTQSAISAFQTSRGIAASGFPDEPTMVALFAGGPPPQQAQQQTPPPLLAAPPAQQQPAPMPTIDMEPIQSPLSGGGQ
ncbi:MAG: peptidoglycan-binding domain-containing protein [Pseudomonadota bacterium]